MIGGLHERWIFRRRVAVLASHLADLLPEGADVLDVGCGDGRLARTVMRLRPDVRFEGIEVLVRPTTAIPVRAFDGARLPVDDKSFDAVCFVDVLHHAQEPEALLREARRVTRGAVLVKDHCRDGLLADATLRFMDRVGNARHGVALPYAYWPEARWRRTFAALGLNVVAWRARLGLYPPPLRPLFERGLHYIACLRPTSG